VFFKSHVAAADEFDEAGFGDVTPGLAVFGQSIESSRIVVGLHPFATIKVSPSCTRTTLARGKSSRIAAVAAALSAGFLAGRSWTVDGEGRRRGSSHVNALKRRLRMPNIGHVRWVVATCFA
jgi:hypothetical protein